MEKDTDTTVTDMTETIANALLDANEQVTQVLNFEDAMVMTSNEGLVVRMEDGTEFQVTVVQSR